VICIRLNPKKLKKIYYYKKALAFEFTAMVSMTVSNKLSSCTSNQEIASWVEANISGLSSSESAMIRHALNYSLQLYADQTLPSGEPVTRHMLSTAEILFKLKVDSDTLAAGILHSIANYQDDYIEKLQSEFSPMITHLVDGVQRISRIQAFRTQPDTAKYGAQIEILRKMLLAMAEDIRVVIIILASRVQTIRYAVANEIPGRNGIARETLDIFAPLANRLGLWQIKWELEDLSLRIIEPARYKKIARLLEETRDRREQYIAQVVAELRHELQQASIRAEVTGRPKHIYSIHKKMKHKDLDFSEIYDARAVRILVDDIKNCYAALGTVHNLWTPIPKEFDDYIAKPKGNNYRSLHTAVTGPENKVLEVQIRTHEMHRHAELGVAAHWRYKEGTRRDARYEEKITWLRQILDWKNDVSDAGELAGHFKTALFEDSVYVLTPQGNVVALPKGSTPVDFAYHVHTELGHRCRGAKVDGVIVSLDYPLQNAQQVEIILAKQGGPSRDWLNPALGYLKSHRARSKARQWFNRQKLESTLAQGKTIVEKMLQRHGMTAFGLDKFAAEFHFTRLNDFLLAVAKGDINNRQLETALNSQAEPTTEQPDLLASKKMIVRPTTQQTGNNIFVVGVDNLLTVLAKCCKPAPPDTIVGFVSARGRGIMIHRQDCRNLSRLSNESTQRLVEVDWGSLNDKRFPVDVIIEAHDRQWLLRDITDILSREKINVITFNAQSRHHAKATIQLTVEVRSVAQLYRALELIKGIPDIISAVRK
jgi:GTP pyrophosphokinase